MTPAESVASMTNAELASSLYTWAANMQSQPPLKDNETQLRVNYSIEYLKESARRLTK